MHYLPILLLFLLITACTETTQTPTATSIPRALGKDMGEVKTIVKKEEKEQQKCQIKGEVLEENELWLKDQAKLISIKADSSTYDPQYGMSHRILEVYNTYNCILDLKLTLPINESPDFPYFLADINYNNDSKIVAIKAAKSIYCLDLTTEKMLPVLIPSYKEKRIEADASSGNIIRLELWEDFLIGYAQDKGSFIFNIKNPKKAKPIMPFAEFKLGDNNFNALFLLPSGKNEYQAVLPHYDWEEEHFSIHPLFKTPVSIDLNIQKSALNNRFLILREKNESRAVLVDMKNRSNKELPKNLLQKNTKEVLKWARKEL